MPEHLIYGLRLGSATSIPGLAPAAPGGPADVDVRFEPYAKAPGRDDGNAEDLYVRNEDDAGSSLVIRTVEAGGDLLLFYPDGMRFRLAADGSSLTAWRPDRLTLDDAAVYLLGPVLGNLLRLRGEICLHGSAVELDGEALGFIGGPGAGKSSTAAALAQRGHRVLSDDLLVLHESEGGFRAQPGYPSLRLWPASVAGLYGSAGALPPIVRGWDKRHLDLAAANAYADEPLPLAAIYVLGDRRPGLTRTAVETLSAGQALLELVANVFANYVPGDPSTRRSEFETLRALSASVPIRRLVQGEQWETVADLPESLREQRVGPVS